MWVNKSDIDFTNHVIETLNKNNIRYVEVINNKEKNRDDILLTNGLKLGVNLYNCPTLSGIQYEIIIFKDGKILFFNNHLVSIFSSDKNKVINYIIRNLELYNIFFN